MSKVHILMKHYANNVSVIEQVFSSRKRAEEHREWIADLSKKDGWTIVKSAVVYVWDSRFSKREWGVRVVPPSGDMKQAVTYYIMTENVA